MPLLDLLYLQESDADTVISAVHKWCAARRCDIGSVLGQQALAAAVRLAKTDGEQKRDLLTALSKQMRETDDMTGTNVIMVVEDEPLIAMDIEETLRNAGFSVKICLSCSDALSWLADHSPAAAILDIRLKDGSCADVASLLENRDIPFLVSSGSDRADADAIFSRSPWINKPCHPNLLVDAVKRAVSQSPREDRLEANA